MSDEIVVADTDPRPVTSLSVREAVQDVHGEDVEFLDERSDLATDDDLETTLDEWGE